MMRQHIGEGKNCKNFCMTLGIILVTAGIKFKTYKNCVLNRGLITGKNSQTKHKTKRGKSFQAKLHCYFVEFHCKHSNL